VQLWLSPEVMAVPLCGKERTTFLLVKLVSKVSETHATGMKGFDRQPIPGNLGSACIWE
jgi:hypothetical protein